MNKIALTSVLALATAFPAFADTTFNRIASFATTENMAEGEDRTVASSAEIISVSDDGMTLVYSDSPHGVLGFVDITDPAAPAPLGNVAMEGEPTTAVIIGKRVFVGVDTTDGNFTAPSGALRMLDLDSEEVLESCDLGGQPDSVAKAPDGSFLAIAIENQRDEDLGDGGLPQMPAGFVVKLPINNGAIDCADMQRIEMSGLADIAPEDPEPEYVDVNEAGEIVVTLQENNHIVVIDDQGAVSGHFSAGTVSLTAVDTQDDGALHFTDDARDLPREPDGVQWLGNDYIVTANEGDWKGGSRGWTIFDRNGGVVYDSGNSFEHAVAMIGHYPDKRSDAKGSEPETIEIGTFDGTPYVFVVSERGSVVGVYDVTDPAAPVLTQMLPSGISPEGAVAIPSRNLMVTANEADLGEDGGARAHVMVFQAGDGPATYPMLTSEGSDPLIGWGALSGMVADENVAGRFYAVSDSAYYAEPAIFTIDATEMPARIIGKTVVSRDGAAAHKLDLEGITTDGKGGFWLASEGDAAKLIPNALYHVNADGVIMEEVGLPPSIVAGATRSGLEGVGRDGDTLWVAVQREWADDAEGHVKLLAYDTDAEDWLGGVSYPLETTDQGWVGLSEITIHNGNAYVLERDNLIDEAAKLKVITRVSLADMQPAPLTEKLPVMPKEIVHDLISDLGRTNGYVVDKVESLAITPEGDAWIVTDNDGVDDSSGETLFFTIGKLN
ncbi:esterase-like activity of phytase family protein [Falsirhodobacter sp. alg1]|uniref:esterase-like activity of phytase family protein n=2 Tax=Falsirhodobacter sp. alg1 TaxID=1472418 RepID=UPI0005EEF6B9|nr:esterase-like activity of phytase family protein [Falsirhodobacter sp. alg1]